MRAGIAAVLAEARADLGYVAPPSGSAAGHEYGIPLGAWCAMWASVKELHAGATPNVDFPWHAFTPNGVAWGKANGRWIIKDPRPGDLVFFMWPAVSPAGRGTPPVCHVGIVEAVRSDGKLVTLEGNTSSTVDGSQYNGGTVARKVRSQYIVGYVRPRYADDWYTGPLGSRIIRQGDEGADVEELQVHLNRVITDLPPLEVDGSDGPLTTARVIVLQERAHATDPEVLVDGIVGPQTVGLALADIEYPPTEAPPEPSIEPEPVAEPDPPPTPSPEPQEEPMTEPQPPASIPQLVRALLTAVRKAIRAHMVAFAAVVKKAVPGIVKKAKTVAWTAIEALIAKTRSILTSWRRTMIPTVSGAIVGWLAARGLPITPEHEAWLTMTLQGLGAGIWYGVGRILEEAENLSLRHVGKIMCGGGTPPVYGEEDT